MEKCSFCENSKKKNFFFFFGGGGGSGWGGPGCWENRELKLL